MHVSIDVATANRDFAMLKDLLHCCNDAASVQPTTEVCMLVATSISAGRDMSFAVN